MALEASPVDDEAKIDDVKDEEEDNEIACKDEVEIILLSSMK